MKARDRDTFAVFEEQEERPEWPGMGVGAEERSGPCCGKSRGLQVGEGGGQRGSSSHMDVGAQWERPWSRLVREGAAGWTDRVWGGALEPGWD